MTIVRALLGALPAWIWSALITGAVLGALLLEQHSAMRELQLDLATEQRDRAAEAKAYADERAAAALQLARAHAHARDTELLARQRIDEVTTHADAQERALRADLDRSAGAADGLRRQLATVRARADAAQRRADATAAELAAERQAGRLADALGECSERYRAVAAAADRAVIRGRACEAAYEGVMAGRQAPTN